MHEAHFLGLLLIHQEVGGFTFYADLARSIGDFGMDEQQIAYLLHDVGADGKHRLIGGNGFAELDTQIGGESAGLHLASDYPTAGLVYQRAEHTTMHGIYPALIVALWMPVTYDVVAILKELHVESEGIIGRTAEAVVFWMVAPGVDDLLHMVLVCSILFPPVPQFQSR